MRPSLAAFDSLSTALRADAPPTLPYLVGVSGGRDSIALLHWLHAMGYRALIVCHFDHQLRAQSAEDGRFVAAVAESLGLQFASSEQDVHGRARSAQQSIETAARNARYEFFAQVALQHGCPRLFLAHHADDQVETLLFNLLRGAGPAGLAAMKANSRRVVNAVELTILRPWLSVWRSDIDLYIASNHFAYREDPSNAELLPTRNRLRHKVIPHLEEIMGRDVRQAIWRTAEVLRADEHFLQNQLPPISREMSVPVLRELPESIQRRTIHSWLKSEGVPHISFDIIERTRALLHSRHAKVNLPAACHVRRRAKKLFIEKPAAQADPAFPVAQI